MTNKLALKGGAPVRTKPFTAWPIHGTAEQEHLLEVLNSGVWSFNGPKELEFARRFASFCGAKEAFCVSNGTVSLEIALRSLRVGPGDEVIVPALTWLATAWAVVQVGAIPIFADVREEDWCLDPKSVREKLTPRTRALIPVHLYNNVAEIDELLEIARSRSLFVIEDCAHAHGSRWGDRGVGTLGQIGSFSFQQSKAVTAGEGGALLTDDRELAARIHGWKHCGRKWRPDSAFGYGGNYRITEFQAAVLLAQLERLDSQLAIKTTNAACLSRHLAKIPGVTLPVLKPKVTRQGMYGYSLRYDQRAFGGVPQDIMVSALCAEGIPAQRPYDVVYRSPLWSPGKKLLRFEPNANLDERLGLRAKCPVAERIAEDEGLVLLHHIFLGSPDDIHDIANAIEKIQQSASELRMDALEKKARSATRSLLRKVGLGS
jgi:L-glutamine:2-deoxy-scyllo-inosose/3-amino-2,3-dideoxy-scyllo-inosose aminotransferase